MSMPPRHPLTIATRGSPLALWQARFVAGLLRDLGVETNINPITTTGDRVQNRFLHEIGGKGLFVKELEQALTDGAADLAVHSLKDMPAKVQAPYALAAVLKRHAATDILILRRPIAERGNIPAQVGPKDVAALGELTIGTGSLRRQALLKGAAPNVQCAPVRGNIDTRLRKLEAGEWDGLILAEASLDRLDLKRGLCVARLDPEWFVPCAGQGALAIETRRDDGLTEWLARLACPVTTACVNVERALLARLGGDCTMPFGCHVAVNEQNRVIGRALLLTREGREVRITHEAPATPQAGTSGFDQASFLDAMATKLAAAGAGDCLRELGLPVPTEFA